MVTLDFPAPEALVLVPTHGLYRFCPRTDRDGTDRDGPRGDYIHTIFLLPHNDSLLVVRGPRRLHKVRLGARKVLGQVLEQRDGDFDVLFFLYVVGHVLVRY